MGTSGSNPSTPIVAILVVVAIGVAVLFEIGAAVCATATVVIGYGLFWTLILLPLLLRRPSRAKLGLHAVLLGSLLILYLAPWNSRKTFLKDFRRIEIGMTVDQVEGIMAKYLRGTGWPAPLGDASATGQLIEAGSGTVLPIAASASEELAIRDSLVYRHCAEGPFDSDWGVVRFRDEKVVATEFLPD